jgi:endonuclease YncB( thermonuclease family)
MGLILLVIILVAGWRAWPWAKALLTPDATMGGRLHVADGDSLTLDGIRVRLLGIDAPELDQTCRLAGMTHPCGREAREHLIGLVAGRSVTCSWSREDRYGRRLGRCSAGETDLAAEMVRSGWAVAYGGYEREETEARAHRRGLWSGDFVWPQDFRRDRHDHREPGWFDRWIGWGRE